MTPETMTEHGRISIPLFRPFRSLTMSITMVLLIGGPINGQQEDIRQVERLGGSVLRLGGEASGGTRISFSGLPITDADLKPLRALTQAKILFLDETQVTDKALSHLAGATSLEGLSLDGTRVTDAGMEQLQNQTKLEWLKLNNTQITDAGLLSLKSLTRLRMLDLAETDATDSGIAELQRELPTLRIWAPDPPLSANSPEVKDMNAETASFRVGMPLRAVATALRKQGIRVCEYHGAFAAKDPKRFLRKFQVYPKFKTADVLFLAATCDRERGVYVIDSIYWWVDFEEDAERPKSHRKNDFRRVPSLSMKDLKARRGPAGPPDP